MKAINILTFIFSLGAFVFAIIIWQQGGHGFAEAKEKFLAEYTKTRKQQSENFFTTLSVKVSKTTADTLHNHFKYSSKSTLSFPDGVYIDSSFIDAVRKDTSIDGMMVAFGAYNPQTLAGLTGKPYVENDVTIIVAPTKKQKIQPNLYFDYGDPCKPPNCSIIFPAKSGPGVPIK